MPEVLSVGGLLVPVLRVGVLLSLLLAPWFAGRFARRLSLEPAWAVNVAENAVWLGLLGARLGFVSANWSAYGRAPWTILYVWQGGFTPLAGFLVSAAFIGWRLWCRPQSWGRYLQALIGGFGVAALLFGLIYTSTRLDLGSSLVRSGDPMPDFTLSDLNGKAAGLASLEGQVVILNFWATWCPPCRREMPLLDAVQKEYGPRGVTVVGIDLEEPPETVRAYIESVGVAYPIWLDDPAQNAPDRTRDVYTKIGGVGLPTTVFIDRNGIVRSSQVGELSRGVLQSRTESLLKP